MPTNLNDGAAARMATLDDPGSARTVALVIAASLIDYISTFESFESAATHNPRLSSTHILPLRRCFRGPPQGSYFIIISCYCASADVRRLVICLT
jgi:hypothetical protein